MFLYVWEVPIWLYYWIDSHTDGTRSISKHTISPFGVVNPDPELDPLLFFVARSMTCKQSRRPSRCTTLTIAEPVSCWPQPFSSCCCPSCCRGLQQLLDGVFLLFMYCRHGTSSLRQAEFWASTADANAHRASKQVDAKALCLV